MLKLFKGLKPYWTLVIGVLVLVFISTMTDLELPDLMSDIVDTGIVQGDVSYILGRGGVMQMCIRDRSFVDSISNASCGMSQHLKIGDLNYNGDLVDVIRNN